MICLDYTDSIQAVVHFTPDIVKVHVCSSSLCSCSQSLMAVYYLCLPSILSLLQAKEIQNNLWHIPIKEVKKEQCQGIQMVIYRTRCLQENGLLCEMGYNLDVVHWEQQHQSTLLNWCISIQLRLKFLKKTVQVENTFILEI